MENPTTTLSDPNLLCNSYFIPLNRDEQDALRIIRTAQLPQNIKTDPTVFIFELFGCLGIEPLTEHDWWIMRTTNTTSLKARWGIAWFTKSNNPVWCFHWDLIHTMRKYADLYWPANPIENHGRIGYYNAWLWLKVCWPMAEYADTDTFPYYA